ncbi:MAG: NAD+ synthase [Geodermatophilaceae bacterium]|nr:NAD+ synthase [Geodermatophilaceae bacterium]
MATFPADRPGAGEQAKQFRIALAQVNMCVGDLAGNAARIREQSAAAQAAGADLVAFPEMMITGYPPEDLVLRKSFAQASQAALDSLAGDLVADGCGELPVVVGYLAHDEGARNAAALLHRGSVAARYYKHHLPNYGVFDEARYFRSGTSLPVITLAGIDVALTICEDLWVDGGPFAVAGDAGVDLIVCINGSPYERAKDDLRLPLVQRRAVESKSTIAYVNIVGAQDELVFDGDSMIVAPDGELLARAQQFEERLLMVDLRFRPGGSRREGPIGPMTVTRSAIPTDQHSAARPRPDLAPAPHFTPMADLAEVWGALVIGLRDYVHKNRFESVILGLSGGIDSALVAALATDAIGADRVYGVSMPSRYSSEHSRGDADDLAQRLGCHFDTIAIEAMVAAYLDAVKLTGLAEENLQARVRGTLLMGLSNEHGHLVLATGNKSEISVGYSTLYGDSVGGFAPIKDVPKTLVWALARWRNSVAAGEGLVEPIPPNSITKSPSAELRPGQQDSDSLPDYEVLDAILADYVDRDLGHRELVERGHDPQTVGTVLQLVDRAEYKRRQFAPGTKISLKSFGRDRRLPITSRWQETTES